MVDVAEWPKWLNDVLTRLDNSSAEVGPSAVHASALISPTLRKELRDHCIELHQLHMERRGLKAALQEIASRHHEEAIGPTGCPGGMGDYARCEGCVARDALRVKLKARE
jgi:hypothetical protein